MALPVLYLFPAARLLCLHYNLSICSGLKWLNEGYQKKSKKKKKNTRTQKVCNRLTTKGWGKELACDWIPLCCRNAYWEGGGVGCLAK